MLKNQTEVKETMIKSLKLQEQYKEYVQQEKTIKLEEQKELAMEYVQKTMPKKNCHNQ